MFDRCSEVFLVLCTDLEMMSHADMAQNLEAVCAQAKAVVPGSGLFHGMQGSFL